MIRILAAISLLSLCACTTSKGVILGERFVKVQNGSAFDMASLNISKYQKLIVPSTCTIHRKFNDDTLDIYMKKVLSYYGHPIWSMHIKTERNKMGSAYSSDGSTLTVATFGEWDSHIEGGSSMHLLLVVPEHIHIEPDKSLSGENSRGHVRDGKFRWGSYGPTRPAPGWHRVRDVPDADHTADASD